jgi:hypothetical protein
LPTHVRKSKQRCAESKRELDQEGDATTRRQHSSCRREFTDGLQREGAHSAQERDLTRHAEDRARWERLRLAREEVATGAREELERARRGGAHPHRPILCPRRSSRDSAGAMPIATRQGKVVPLRVVASKDDSFTHG